MKPLTTVDNVDKYHMVIERQISFQHIALHLLLYLLKWQTSIIVFGRQKVFADVREIRSGFSRLLD